MSADTSPPSPSPRRDRRASGSASIRRLAHAGFWLGVVALPMSWPGVGGLVGVLGGPLSMTAWMSAGADLSPGLRRLAIAGVVINAVAATLALVAFHLDNVTLAVGVLAGPAGR